MIGYQQRALFNIDNQCDRTYGINENGQPRFCEDPLMTAESLDSFIYDQELTQQMNFFEKVQQSIGLFKDNMQER